MLLPNDSHYPVEMGIDFDGEGLVALEERIRTILPDLYQDSYEDVKPVSMGSAALKYDEHEKVAWSEMWESFCDLAMAGGPPHKGTLLTPAGRAEIDAKPGEYQTVVAEICRGIEMVSDLKAKVSKYPGWIRMQCDDALMAEWLVRAIVMENVSAHWEGSAIFLPAGPAYRIEKEIKNVITVIAKTCHYWVDHMWISQQRKIGKLFASMASQTPLVQVLFPDVNFSGEAGRYDHLGRALEDKTGLTTNCLNHGWLGVECSSVNMAIWMMRGMVASNVLSRREGLTLFVPIAKLNDQTHERVTQTFAHVFSLAQTKNVS